MNKIKYIAIILLCIGGCKEPYDLELNTSDQSLLVVEGVLNAGQGATNIKLSRTVSFQDNIEFKPVLFAQLSVEDNTGTVYQLTETGAGNYTHNQLPLVFGEEYRLRIKTTDNKEYLSDYVVARSTPDIDSITWKKEDNSLQILASTHDPANETWYYKWDFDETWEIRSFYMAEYEFIGATYTIIPHSMFNYRCWKYASSNTIAIGSSAQLQSDVISESPIHIIPPGSEKLGVRYSILVRQQAISKEAYEYFKLMKKNTESLGSIFDPQPSELKGNIKCLTHPDEGVIGYLTASNYSEKRHFITAQQAAWSYNQDNCFSERVKNDPDSLAGWMPNFLPWGAEEAAPGVALFYYLAPATCVDCTTRGGALDMPSYW